MTKNTNLHRAKEAKNDEFYTQLSDIERELSHYDNAYFKDKVVLCNCNDGVTSKFWEYFHKNFKFKGLKKLIGISYALHEGEHGKAYIYDGGTTADSDMDLNSCTEVELRGKGDFREEECIEYLKEADVVVTNPPFSLFREYVAQLLKLNKKFLIIGNKNCITYKEIFPLIRNDELWIGNTPMSTDMLFSVPKEAEQTLISKSKSGSAYRIIDGVVYARSASIWFTNLDHKKRHEKLILWKTYNAVEYPKYDNYDAINVDKVSDIPVDYEGVMGVPISFLDKYNPDQFEIVAFRKGEDGKDLVFTREREREFNRTFVSLYDLDCRDDKKCRRQNQWEAYLRKNNNQAKIEPIDLFYPRRINFSGNDRTHLGGSKGKYTYGRIFIRRRADA